MNLFANKTTHTHIQNIMTLPPTYIHTQDIPERILMNTKPFGAPTFTDGHKFIYSKIRFMPEFCSVDKVPHKFPHDLGPGVKE